MTVEERIEKLERRLGRWQIGTLAAILVSGMAIVSIWLRATETPERICVNGQPCDSTYLDGHQLRLDSVTVGHYGVFDQLGIMVARDGGFAALGLHGNKPSLGLISQTAHFGVYFDHPDEIMVAFVGAVTSELSVNTRTGEWTLARYREDAKKNRIDPVTTQLLPPLP